MAKKLNIAFTGNPNSGKTTLFNALTGARQHVGNYPGVTVERKEGTCKYNDYLLNIIDLPGTYSLTAYSVEELVARDYIIDNHPDVVVDVIDASNLERNLYMAVQLMEMNVPLVLAFNMSDVARQRGMVFDIEKLSALLGVPIVMTVGNKSKGLDDLLETIVKVADGTTTPCNISERINFGQEIEEELQKIQATLNEEHILVEKYGRRFLALKLLENDKEIIEQGHSDHVLATVKTSRDHIRKVFGDAPDIIVADRRYGFISGACQEAVESNTELRHDTSDYFDTILTHPVAGLPIFIVLMYLVFQMTFLFGQYPVSWLESLFDLSAGVITAHWPGGSDSVLLSLIVDGIIGGVGGVVVFLPNIMILFFAISILEDSGYMARAAFIMDHIMHKIGLHGKSFIPMLIGFGCSVPAIMATRILENRRNRLTTIMVIPLMSCGARLPIYIMLTGAFFPKHRGLVMATIYFTGVLLAVICAKLLRNTLFKGETTPFVMELPPYRVPTFRGVLIHMWQRGWMYLRKAGTIILGISIILWAAATYPKADPTDLAGLTEEAAQTFELKHSIAGRMGVGLEKVIKPIGFDWKVGTGLIGAFAAKEVFVSQMGIVYSLGGDTEASSEALQKHLQADYNPLQGFCIMLFCLISMPCVATVAMTRHETGSWKWALFQVAALTILAYIVTFIVYQLGILTGIGV